MAAFMSSLMTCAQGLALLLAVLLTAWPLGLYIARVMNGEAVRAQRCVGWLERACYRLTGIDSEAEMHWRDYTLALLGFSLLCTVLLYATQRLQAWLPLNPQQFANVGADTAFNTAVSFVTNTNWQSYVGEASLSYFTQMFGLAVQHFVSAAVGIAVAIAFIRGLARHDTHTIGNFWVDVTRSVVYVLLPLSLVIALLLVAQGVVQNFTPYQSFMPWQTGAASANTTPLASSGTSLLPMGPVASQEAIKQLGTNGGGFFNANSAHPFENPTPLTNALQMWALLVIPFALTWTFGRMVGDRRQGHALLITMLLLVVVMSVVATRAEQRAIPWVTEQGVDQQASDSQAGGNMEGKEVRFGINASALFATITTATSTGAVNSQHDSYSPIGGLVTLVMMQLGEVAPGGVGTGLVSMLIFALLAVFIAGLMIGRTPEYLGKKIEAYEMKLIALIILITPILVLVGTSLAVLTASARSAVGNPGAHGFSEILYAFTSAGNNNGSAFAGLSAGSLFYNTILGVVMWLGRFWVMVPVLAMAGSLAAKKRLPVGVGTLPTQGPLFVVLLLGSVLLVGLLTYVPALALGPVVEHLQLYH